MTMSNYDKMTKAQLVELLSKAKEEYSKLREAYKKRGNTILILRQKLNTSDKAIIESFAKYLEEQGRA